MKSTISKIIKHKSDSLIMNCLKSGITILLISFSVFIHAQQDKLLKGTVVDASTGNPIAAAQISIPSKNVSAVTDEQGNFEIKIVSPLEILHVTAIGYMPVEVALQSRNQIKISLYSEGFTAYFKNVEGISGGKSQSSLTSSVAQQSNFEKTSAMIADDILQNNFIGQARIVGRSGQAGIGSNIFIRGINSLNAGSQPLYIVDGIVWNNHQNIKSIHHGFFSNPMDNIDVNDIESISVIKDGTSIYGSKASNGVVIIKTKRASSMVTKINVNAMTGTSETPGSLPMLDGEQFRIYASDLTGQYDLENFDIQNVGFLNTDPSTVSYKTAHNVTDWNKLVYQQGITQQYNINVTGGDDKALYYFSLGYANNTGLIKATDWNRINARFNADFKLFNVIDLLLNIGITRNNRNLIDDGIGFYSSPTWIAKIKSPFLSQYSWSNQGELTKKIAPTDYFNVGNPVGIIENSYNYLKKYWFNISLSPTYRINKDMVISSMLDYNLYKSTESHFIPMTFTAERLLPNKGYSKNMISNKVMRNSGFYNNTWLTYEKNPDFYQQMKFTAGFRIINNFLEWDYIEEHNSGSNNNTTITGSYRFLDIDGVNNLSSSFSTYYQAQYSYDKRYFVDAALSLDASSRFGKHTEGGINFKNIKKDANGNVISDNSLSMGVFPSINAAWIVSSEAFMKHIPSVNYLKLRAGYGLTGNDGITEYESIPYFSSVRFMEKANGLLLSNIGNTKVQWEVTGRANAGLDIGLLNDKITLQLDVYTGKTDKLLTLQPLPDITGLGYYWSNGGSLTNNGFELNTDIKMMNSKDMQWEVGFTVGTYKNKITSLPDNKKLIYSISGYELLTEVGQPVGMFYGYNAIKVFATEAEATEAGLKILNEDGTYSSFTAGDVKFEDVNGDKVIDLSDRKIIGNPHPDFYGNFRSKWNIKRFSIQTIFTYSLGNDIFNMQRSLLESGNSFSNQTTALLRRWTGEGQKTDIPKSTLNDPMGNARFSSRWIEDGSYLKFKTLSISYDVPVKIKFIEGLNIWISADNIYTFSNYLGQDPEVSIGHNWWGQGIDAGMLPYTRAYNIGVKLNL